MAGTTHSTPAWSGMCYHNRYTMLPHISRSTDKCLGINYVLEMNHNQIYRYPNYSWGARSSSDWRHRRSPSPACAGQSSSRNDNTLYWRHWRSCGVYWLRCCKRGEARGSESSNWNQVYCQGSESSGERYSRATSRSRTSYRHPK